MYQIIRDSERNGCIRTRINTVYPDGLAGEDIPLGARILAVADAYDAMTTHRAYRNAMPVSRVLEILKQGAGSQWDPQIISAFLELMQQECPA